MTDPNPHAVDPADEGRHDPSDDPLWNESHYLDFVSRDGTVSGYARIGLYPNLGVTWWTTTVVGPGPAPGGVDRLRPSGRREAGAGAWRPPGTSSTVWSTGRSTPSS